MNFLFPTTVLGLIFAIGGVSTGTIPVERLLGSDYAASTSALNATQPISFAILQSDSVCDGGVAYRHVTITANPVNGLSTLSVVRNSDGLITPVISGVSFTAKADSYMIKPTYFAGFSFDPNSLISFTVSGTCTPANGSTGSNQTIQSTSTASTTTQTSTTTQASTTTQTQTSYGAVKFNKQISSNLSCVSGAPTRTVTISADPAVGVTSLTVYSVVTGKQIPVILGVPIALASSRYYIYAHVAANYSVDTSTVGFTIDGTCPSVTATNTQPTTYTQGTYGSLGGTNPTTTSETIITITSGQVDANFKLPSDLGEPDHVRYDLIPRLAKDASVVYTATGEVNFGIETPSNNVRIFLGDANHWRSDLVFGPDQGLARVSGSNRWKVSFNSTRIPDGAWRLRAAYLSTENYWVYTDTLRFTVKNEGESGNGTQSSTTPVTANTEAGNNGAHRTKPALRLVLNDRAIMTARPVFDNEEVEVRISTAPISRLQFLVYSTDGALTPAIKDIGGGIRDELLSRDGAEVWTRLVDMTRLPTGVYRIFARVRYIDGTQSESEPRTITIQHLSHAEVPAFGDNKSDADIAASLTRQVRENILKHVSDPSTCSSQEECAVFCSANPEAKNKCVAFSRYLAVATTSDVVKLVKDAQDKAKKYFGNRIELHVPESPTPLVVGATSSPATTTTTIRVISNKWQAPEATVRPSLVDVFPEDALKLLVDRKSQLSAELPPEVDSVPALQAFCGVAEHIDKCTRVVARLIPSATTTLANQAESVRSYEEKSLQVFEQRTGARAYVDSNGNGITDYDKVNIYHTDLTKRDTLGSGVSDGALLLGNGNPSKAAQVATNSAMLIIGENMAIENPKITGSTQPKLLSVVTAGVLETEKDANGNLGIKKIVFAGKAPPNSFVRLFTFSTPIVVTVKADENGNWSYILDRKLPDGTHTAYAVVADNSGKILAKSEPLPFVKTASAISLGSVGLAPTPAPKGVMSALSPLAVAALIVAILGIALSIIGVVIGLRKSV